MSPLTTPQLLAAALVASPALWAGFVDHSLPMDLALTRYLVAVAACWVATSVLASFIRLPGVSASGEPSPGGARETSPEPAADAPDVPPVLSETGPG